LVGVRKSENATSANVFSSLTVSVTPTSRKPLFPELLHARLLDTAGPKRAWFKPVRHFGTKAVPRNNEQLRVLVLFQVTFGLEILAVEMGEHRGLITSIHDFDMMSCSLPIFPLPAVTMLGDAVTRSLGPRCDSRHISQANTPVATIAPYHAA
jgi:hypothetical protein